MKKSPQKRREVHRVVRHGVIGIDEVGRGPLAGPVTVCAVYIEDEKRVKKHIFSDTIRDSKKLSKANRCNIYRTIRDKRNLDIRIEYAVSSRSAAYIDAHGISRAVRQCLLSCIRTLIKKSVPVESVQIRLDAGLVIPLEKLNQESFIKGDERFTEIAIASILAKVTRDLHMKKLAKQHIEYGWNRNAGYGTKEHCKAIKVSGITKYHRRSYLKAFKLFNKAEVL